MTIKIYVFYVVCLALICCSTNVRNETVSEQLSKDEAIKDIGFEKEQNSDSVTFFSNCSKLMSRSWQGALQASNHERDSIHYLCFAACYDCAKTFEIVFLYGNSVSERKKLGYDGIWKIFQNGCSSFFSGFDCYAFVVRMKDPETLEDIHETNMAFPLSVEIYKRVQNDSWRFIKIDTVKDLESYQELRFKSIYGIAEY